MKTPLKLSLSLVCAGVLTACGGSDDPASTYSLSGNVTGLNGTMVVAAADEQVSLESSGEFGFETEFSSGDSVSVNIVEAPELQACDFTSASSFTFESSDIDSLAITCRDLELYTATVDSATTSDDQAVTIDVLANDTSEYTDVFEVTEVTQPEQGSTSIVDNQIVYQPNAGFAGTDTFTYTGTDGQQTSTADVTVTVTQTVAIQGQVTDAPLANATVVVTIGGQNFEATTNDNGEYQIDAVISDMSAAEYAEINAQGSGDQSYVTLSSRLTNVANLLAQAGEDRTLDRSESNAVQVTQLSTARNFMLEQIAGDQPISDDNIQLLLTDFNTQLMLEMAGMIKLLADNPAYELPEGFDTIEAFLADSDAYNAMLETATTSGDLQIAVDATLADSNVTEPTHDKQLSDYYGDYINVARATKYTGRWSNSSLQLTESGLSASGSAFGSVSVNTDGSFDTNVQLSSAYISANLSWFDNQNIEMDEVTRTALEEYFSSRSDLRLSYDIYLINFDVLDATEQGLLVRNTERRELSETRFYHNGQWYTIPGQTIDDRQYAPQTWYAANAMATGETFAIADGSKWVLPMLFNYAADYTEEAPYQERGINDLQLLTMQTTDGLSGTWSNDYSGETGTWQLTNDKTVLEYSNTVAEESAYFSVRYARNDEHVTELVSSSRNVDDPAAPAYFRVDNAGEMNFTLDPSLVKADEGEVTMVLINMQNSDEWGESGPTYSGYAEMLYAWTFNDDGSAGFHQGQCEGNAYAFEYPCTADKFSWSAPETQGSMSNLSWAYIDNFVHIARPEYSSKPDCVGEFVCGGRFFAPVKQNTDTGIVTVIEMDHAAQGSVLDRWGDLKEGGIEQRIGPRINHLHKAPINGAEAAVLSHPLSKYSQGLQWPQRDGAAE